jgi:3'(2'), 5'-bisphosphate nucleotidase
MMNDDQLLMTAVRAAMNASLEILKVYQGEIRVEMKDDRSPLTLADRNAHTAIASTLAATGLPVLSEEGRSIPYEIRKSWERFWMVDPLDGTKEFIKRNGEFTVNIALIDEGKPVMGVILVPVSGKLYFGSASAGAYSTESAVYPDNLARLISVSKRLDGSHEREDFLVVASRSHLSDETLEYVEKVRVEHPGLGFVSIGSSLKLCLIAEAAADVYPRFGPTMEWDTAAGHALVELSGGYVQEAVTGKPMSYNKEDLLNPWFIAGRL